MISAPTRLSGGDSSLPPYAPVRRRPLLLAAGTTGRSRSGSSPSRLSLSRPCRTGAKSPPLKTKDSHKRFASLWYIFERSRAANLAHPLVRFACTKTLPGVQLVYFARENLLQASNLSTLRRHSAARPGRRERTSWQVSTSSTYSTSAVPSSTVQRNFAKRGKLFYNQDKALPLSGHRFRIERLAPCLSRRRS